MRFAAQKASPPDADLVLPAGLADGRTNTPGNFSGSICRKLIGLLSRFVPELCAAVMR